MSEPNTLDIRAASKQTTIPVGSLYHLVQQGLIPHLRRGRRVLFLQKDIDSWLESLRVPVRETPSEEKGGAR